MCSTGISPDPITFNTLLEVVAAASHLGLATSRDAERVLDLMIDYAIPFEITSFRALVRVWQGEASSALARTGRLRGWHAAGAGGSGGGLGEGRVPRLVAPAGQSSERRGAMERFGALLSVVATAAWAGAATPADVFTLLDRMSLEGLQVVACVSVSGFGCVPVCLCACVPVCQYTCVPAVCCKGLGREGSPQGTCGI